MPAKDAVDIQFLAENSSNIDCHAGMDRILTYVFPSSQSVLERRAYEMTGKRVDGPDLVEDLRILAAAIRYRSPTSREE